ncbi:anti-sigma factor antagonist [Collinsella sp. AGMB00827]|uniref:Anti-sigma factor antagonist n=1 Tax=Collinsella ureilytica TaxID=2869515 RepID=A0ABS7MI39_9ACTN|nr:anti-sigma factor antagonist [Collinsella urealyticum]MBY4797026.1 anti-sigma factor antagonist [Collinsella urealyticum]
MSEASDISVIVPAGDIDLTTVPALREHLNAVVQARVRRVLIGCQNVSFIDSSGLALLLCHARKMAAYGGMLSLANASEPLARIFQIARLSDILHVTRADRPPVPMLEQDAMPWWSRTVRVHPGVEHLGASRRRVADLLVGLPLDEEGKFDTALACGEALSNALDHTDGSGCLLTLRAFDDRVVIEVRDCGCGFEIADDELPVESEERGRGIRLMRMLMDRVEVMKRKDAESGTCVRLIKLFRRDPVA